MIDARPVVMLDLNGTVHAYTRGWQREKPLYDPPTEGFKEWATEASEQFQLVIWPTHMNRARDLFLIKQWLKRHDLDKLDLKVVDHPPRGLRLKIDDRAVSFTGDWKDYPLEMIHNFKTWSGR